MPGFVWGYQKADYILYDTAGTQVQKTVLHDKCDAVAALPLLLYSYHL